MSKETGAEPHRNGCRHTKPDRVHDFMRKVFWNFHLFLEPVEPFRNVVCGFCLCFDACSCVLHDMSLHNVDVLWLLGSAASLCLLLTGVHLRDLKLVLPVCTLRTYLWATAHDVARVRYGVPVLSTAAFIGYMSYELLKLGRNDGGRDSKRADPLRPLIIPSRTTHTRLFPKKHGFSYSYLLIGVPVGWKGSAASMVSADAGRSEKPGAPRAWFSVNAEDYLERGQGYLGLDGKLALYLKSQVCSSNASFVSSA